jgi:hypothetical protein
MLMMMNVPQYSPRLSGWTIPSVVYGWFGLLPAMFPDHWRQFVLHSSSCVLAMGSGAHHIGLELRRKNVG